MGNYVVKIWKYCVKYLYKNIPIPYIRVAALLWCLLVIKALPIETALHTCQDPGDQSARQGSALITNINQ